MSKSKKGIIGLIVIIIIIVGVFLINKNIKSRQVNNNIESEAEKSSSKIEEKNGIINETKEKDLADEVESYSNTTNNIKNIIDTGINTSIDTTTYPKQLNDKELKEIEKYLNLKENNGFVSPYNIYTKPEEINLNVIFYDAFALEGGNTSLSEDELNAYKKAGRFGDTDIRKVTTKEAKERYLEKTGENLTNISTRLNWIYLSQYDAYYTEGGDTGMVSVTCLSGVENQDEISVIEIIAGDTKEEVTLKKNGNNYLFVSNIKK